MALVGSPRRRSRWLSRANRAAITLVALAATFGFAAACQILNDFCDPVHWVDGTKTPDYLRACCSPVSFDGGVVDDPRCPNYDGPDAGDGGHAMNDGDAGDASADGPIGEGCPGECVPWPPAGWDWPSLVWIGPKEQAPPCPPLLEARYEGHGELDASAGCDCQCDPPVLGCALPTITTSAATCATADAGLPQTPYDLPSGWDGGCASIDAGAMGEACDGGPCVQSLTLAPLVASASCAPLDTDPTPTPATWGQFARECRGAPPGACDNDQLCAPPPAPGFHRCVSLMGAYDCTAPLFAPYTQPYVFYAGLQDTRTCAPCGCDAPSGSSCAARISLFSDGACTSPAIDGGSVGTTAPLCVDLAAGATPSITLAMQPIEAHGACQPSGGDGGGAAIGLGPTTFCCMPSL